MTRATAKYYPPIGEVSSDTLRTEDLLDTFAYELKTHIKRMRLSREQRKRMRELHIEAKRWADHWDEYMERYGSQGEESASELVNELQDALNEIAPPYTYFGSSNGDGASFGFWPDIEGAEFALPKMAPDNNLRQWWGHDVLLVNDHGNVDCGHVDRRGRFKPYWSCV